MKAIWKILSTLAIANLMAIAGFMAWLAKSDRLNGERVEAIRALLSKTITAETAEKDEAVKKAEEEAAAAKAANEANVLPVRAVEKLARANETDDVAHQNKLRLERELRSLQEFLVRENERLVKQEADIKNREEMFAQERKKIEQTAGTEQFQKAMATLGGLKAKDAQSMLNELLVGGKREQVISYLNAMDERQRSKVMTEFNKVDPKVAADLLEELRRYGVGESAEEATPNVTDPVRQ